MTDEKNTTEPTVRDYLAGEFGRARAALVGFEHGAAGMKDGQRVFDDVWSGIIKSAVRLYGKAATRDALVAMGRPEDVAKMY